MIQLFKSGIGVLLVGLVFSGCAKSPQDDISAAESALRAARDAGARECAPEQFKSAEEMMARTYKLNDDKDYDKAKETAVTTKELSEVARFEAQKNVTGGCKPGEPSANAATDATGDGARLSGSGMSESDVAKEVAATKTGEGSLGEGTLVRGLKAVYFEYDQANLSPDALTIIGENSEWLKDRPTAKVQIEGHTDERGTAEYNLALGERRAKAVRDALVRLGIEKERVTTISYGEETPAERGSTEAAYSKNRRAEFVVK
jgi:peptidoglycan-associated lipoprotein